MKTEVLLVAGARPNYMKIAPIHWAIERRGHGVFDAEIVHTGQHYDARMSSDFFRDLHLPAPGVNLGVGSGSHAEQTAKVMIAFERVVMEKRPGIVVVVGDVNSTAACALVAAKVHYNGATPFQRPLVAHVEAGLRSRDRTMPEEVNRVVTDAVSDVLFTTCREATVNLLAEGIPAERIRFVGNPMIDSLLRCLGAAERCGLLDELALRGMPFGLCTLHRPSNVDHPAVLEGILDALAEIASDVPILMPLHPRTRARVAQFGLRARLTPLARPASQPPRKGLMALEPLPYLEMLMAMKAARFVLTDSGGIQEETAALGVPCVTLRDNTERPVTITEGTNVLAGVTRRGILEGLEEALRKTARGGRVPELWDGRAGERIVAALEELARAGSAWPQPRNVDVAVGRPANV
jgi:UDP-N-acetylglucosamine 2-epimerase (non-hydrolysing)